MEVPKNASIILKMLAEAGFDGYVVGGCVRDTLLHKSPNDWDICTDAKPDDILHIFKDFEVIPTGLQHGTVTVVVKNENGESECYEVTTYRVDGEYTDGRHPDSVQFTPDLSLDLARRDFTINAMAYNKSEGLVDLYGGIKDLQNKLIRCVGVSTDRFTEDSLRILRAMRFSSVLNFEIEKETQVAMNKLFKGLEKVSTERIMQELSKLLSGENAANVIRDYSGIVFSIIPELTALKGFKQNNVYHIYDVWEHTLHVLEAAPCNLTVRLAALFHDIGKVYTYTEEDGVGHFYGHVTESVFLTKNILKRLKFSNDIIEEVFLLIANHDVEFIATKKFVRKMLLKMPPEVFLKLLDLVEADILAQNPVYNARLGVIAEVRELLYIILSENDCFSLKQLKINGFDLIKMGVPSGKEIGKILNILLNKVVEEELENDVEVLKKYVRELFLCLG